MRRREQPIGNDKKDKKKKKKHAVAASTPPPPADSSTLSLSSVSSSRKKSSTTKRRDSSSSSTDMYEARRSTRVDVNKYSHDGDSWQEILAVCEMPATKNGQVKMKIRSYYSNRRTGDRVWDEPPSGASKILPATEEMRKMAEAQLQEMQITFGTALNEPPPSKEKKRGFFRKLTSPSTSAADSSTPSPKYKVKYKPGSILSKIAKEPSKTKKQHDDLCDPEVQKAIALSMNESGTAPGTDNDNEPVIRSEVSFRDDEMAMVMAMSLSEAECKQRQPTSKVSEEEEELQRALQESRRSTSTRHVAALPVKDEFSGLLGLSQSSTSSEDDCRRGTKQRGSVTRLKSSSSDDSSLNQKMPAKPTKSVREYRDRTKEGTAANDGNGKAAAEYWNSASSGSNQSSSSLDKKMPAQPTTSISVRGHNTRSETAMLARVKSGGRKAAERDSSAKSSSLNVSKGDRLLEQAIKVESKATSSQKLSSGNSSRPMTEEKSDATEAASSAIGASKARSSQNSSSDSSSSRPTLDGKRDSKAFASSSSPPPSPSRAASKSSMVNATSTSDSKAGASHRSLTGNGTGPRISQSASSGSSRSSLTTDGRSDLSKQRMQDGKSSGDSSSTTQPTKPAPSASSKMSYGKSVRPPSSKNLTIARSSSSGSRHSLSSAREQAPSYKNATSPTTFSPYTDTVELSPKAGVTIKQYSDSRSAQRSLFGGSNQHEFIEENVSMAKAALKKQGLNGAQAPASTRASREMKQGKPGKL